MNPDFPHLPKEEREQRLTALLLGELAPAETAELRAALATDPELARELERLRQTIDLVRETTALNRGVATDGTTLRLDDERRKKLLASFQTPAPVVVRPRFAAWRWRPAKWAVPLAAAAVIVGLLMLFALEITDFSLGHRRMELAQRSSSSVEWEAAPKAVLAGRDFSDFVSADGTAVAGVDGVPSESKDGPASRRYRSRLLLTDAAKPLAAAGAPDKSADQLLAGGLRNNASAVPPATPAPQVSAIVLPAREALGDEGRVKMGRVDGRVEIAGNVRTTPEPIAKRAIQPATGGSEDSVRQAAGFTVANYDVAVPGSLPAAATRGEEFMFSSAGNAIVQNGLAATFGNVAVQDSGIVQLQQQGRWDVGGALYGFLTPAQSATVGRALDRDGDGLSDPSRTTINGREATTPAPATPSPAGQSSFRFAMPGNPDVNQPIAANTPAPADDFSTPGRSELPGFSTVTTMSGRKSTMLVPDIHYIVTDQDAEQTTAKSSGTVATPPANEPQAVKVYSANAAGFVNLERAGEGFALGLGGKPALDEVEQAWRKAEPNLRSGRTGLAAGGGGGGLGATGPGARGAGGIGGGGGSKYAGVSIAPGGGGAQLSGGRNVPPGIPAEENFGTTAAKPVNEFVESLDGYAFNDSTWADGGIAPTPAPSATIHAKFMNVEQDNSRDLGFNWNYAQPAGAEGLVAQGVSKPAPATTAYFRTEFDTSNLELFNPSLNDGAVLYINGAVVKRDAPTSGKPAAGPQPVRGTTVKGLASNNTWGGNASDFDLITTLGDDISGKGAVRDEAGGAQYVFGIGSGSAPTNSTAWFSADASTNAAPLAYQWRSGVGVQDQAVRLVNLADAYQAQNNLGVLDGTALGTTRGFYGFDSFTTESKSERSKALNEATRRPTIELPALAGEAPLNRQSSPTRPISESRAVTDPSGNDLKSDGLHFQEHRFDSLAAIDGESKKTLEQIKVQNQSVVVSGMLVPIEEKLLEKEVAEQGLSLSAPLAFARTNRFVARSGGTVANNLGALNELSDEVEHLQQLRNKLQNNIDATEMDLNTPKQGTVSIIEPAEAAVEEKPSLWGRITGAFSSDVQRHARVSAEQNMSDVDPRAVAYAPSPAPYWTRTESEEIQSKAVLGKVVEKLKLDEAWAVKNGGKKLTKDEAVTLLKKKVDVRNAPNTTLLDINVRAADGEEAARIANTIAEVYKNERGAIQQTLARNGMVALRKQVAERDQKIARAKEELELRRKQLGADLVDTNRPKPSAASAIPQPEVLTRDNAFSTFSLNVADVSFKLAAASLEKGALPDSASIRSEEFLNAFDYRDPLPAPGVPVAFSWERARYPFAHNRDALRFSVKTAGQGRDGGRPLNIVLLLDNSGSMERADRVKIIQEALRALAAQLKPADKLSVVTFSRSSRLWADGVSGAQAAEVANKIAALTPEGGTNLEDALDLAYRTALRHYAATAMNRVVLLTDGAANLGNVEPAALKAKVEGFRKQGVALDCFGIGWEGFNDDLLEQLSRNGDGRYGFVNTPEEAATEFAGQLAGALKVAASDVKVQVEFNPKRVTAYRQVGYAKHQLTKQQFRDNTVDAAEISASEAGNGLYIIETNPRGEGPIATVRARFRVPQTSDYREHEWTVPFGSSVDLEQSGNALRLATSAAAFSEWLAGSPFAGEVTTDRLLGLLTGVPEVYGADPRPKKLEWMIRQAKSISGK